MSKQRTKANNNRIALVVMVVSILLGVIGWLLNGEGFVASLQMGAIVGGAVGAMMWPIVRNPARSNLTVYGAAAGLLGMVFFELGRFAIQLQGNGSLWTNTAVIGAFAYAAVFRILYVAVGTAIIASLFSTPENVFIGLIVGVLLGCAFAGLALPFLASQGIVLSIPITRIALGFVLALIFTGLINQ